jgi:hypothetical protein
MSASIWCPICHHLAKRRTGYEIVFAVAKKLNRHHPVDGHDLPPEI